QVEHDEGVLAAREEQHWALTGRRDLTEDVDRLRLQRGEMADAVVAHRRNTPLSMTPSGSGSFSLMTRRAWLSRVEVRPRRGRPRGAARPDRGDRPAGRAGTDRDCCTAGGRRRSAWHASLRRALRRPERPSPTRTAH